MISVCARASFDHDRDMVSDPSNGKQDATRGAAVAEQRLRRRRLRVSVDGADWLRVDSPAYVAV